MTGSTDVPGIVYGRCWIIVDCELLTVPGGSVLHTILTFLNSTRKKSKNGGCSCYLSGSYSNRCFFPSQNLAGHEQTIVDTLVLNPRNALAKAGMVRISTWFSAHDLLLC